MPLDATNQVIDSMALAPLNVSDFVQRLDVPHVHEYFGVWSVHEETFRAAADHAARIDLQAHVRANAGEAESAMRSEYEVAPGGVAIIEISGPMMKFASSFSGGTSTVRARRQIRLAASDEEVGSIVIRIDSPGGTVSGTKDLADEVAAAARKKPVYAFIEDLGASAAYWVASQARQVFANETALVGSIGTFAVIEDYSGRAAQLGIKVHVIRAGQFKGSGQPGTEVTSEQLAEWQRIVNGLNEHFLRAVSAGRSMAMDRVREIADGRVHVGAEALRLGLVDRIQSFDQTISQARKPGSSKMSERTETQQPASTSSAAPASYHELVAGCVGADAGFICSQLERKATLSQAQANWMAEQNQRIAAARADADQAKAAQKKPGQDPVTGPAKGAAAAASSGDPIGEWNEAVAAKVKAGFSRAKAVSAVNRENPDLRVAMLQAHNQAHGRRVDLVH